MKNKKRAGVILISMVLALQVAGCGKAEPPVNSGGTQSERSAVEETGQSGAEDQGDTSEQEVHGEGSQQVEATEVENTDSAGDSRILIAYFSAGENSDVDVVSSASVTTVDGEAKGRLRAVADMIQGEAGVTLFSIQTSVKYPGDGNALIDYAAQEQDEDARPELTSHIENLYGYDVIFVGFPNMEQGFEGVLCA